MEISPTSFRSTPSNYRTTIPTHAATWTSPFSSPSPTVRRSPQGSQSALRNGDWKQKVDHLKKFFGKSIFLTREQYVFK